MVEKWVNQLKTVGALINLLDMLVDFRRNGLKKEQRPKWLVGKNKDSIKN